VLVIFDEVMTGFGRTGDWFACMKAHVEPDIIAVSKGITGGFLPLALTMCKERVWDAFYDDDLHKAFFHSHSYTANPIACAAAVASLDLMEYDDKPFKQMEERHKSCAKRWLGTHRKVHNFRFCGTIAAMDLRLNRDSDYFSDMAPKLRSRFLQEGLLLRPLGNTIYLMPPYCIDDETLERVYGNIRLVVDSL
jgi:adenosylmethionine---8-amino-7-oxononanoate aminotransferase